MLGYTSFIFQLSINNKVPEYVENYNSWIFLLINLLFTIIFVTLFCKYKLLKNLEVGLNFVKKIISKNKM